MSGFSELIGVIVFFSMIKNLSKKFTSSKQILPYLIGAVLLRNLGFFSFFGNSGITDFINGFLNAVIIMGVVRIITLKHRERRGESPDEDDAKKKKMPESPWEMVDEIFSDKKKKNDNENYYPSEIIPETPLKTESSHIKAINTEHARKISEKAVLVYLQRRNFKSNPAKDTDFDITAIDYQKKEFQIKIISFAKDKKENLIELSADTFQKALNLGRNFMLFIITETEEDDSSNYLGNYVKVYKVDSILSDIDFKKIANKYQVTLAEIRKHASDWEASIR